MRTIKGLASWILVIGALTALRANGAIRPELGSPVAIDRISDTEFYILSSDGTVRRLRNSGGTFQQSSKFSIQGFPIDFTYSVSDQIASLFVCSTLAGKGVLSRYATDGSLMKRWWLWHTCGGLDFDPENHALYAATTDTHEIYRLDIRKGGDPEVVGELPGTGKIGPIAVDSRRNLLYASDVSDGIVYEYNLTRRSSRAIASDLGSPVALYFDFQSQLLYVADATAKRILYISPSPASRIRQTAQQKSRGTKSASPGVVVRILIKESGLDSPSGVVRGANGDLVVSDYAGNRIFVVSAIGQIKMRYPP
jgi:DNA-binding beta-propeller fold protein YncE